MRANEFIIEAKLVDYEGITLKVTKNDYELMVDALDDWGNKVLGHVTFYIGDDKELDPQDLWVNEKYQRQGIAKTMYDYVKKLGYKIVRSWDQTDAGSNFWDKHRGDVRVWEDVPQPGESSGAPKQFGPDAKIQTRQMTVRQIISSIPGLPYYNNVVDDWDAKDYSWGVTKKVIEYATYLKEHPESLAQLPPILVLNGKFEDGAHRVSAIWLLQQRMDPKNPLWKNAKLNIQFVKQGVAEAFDKPYKGKWEKSDYGDVDLNTKLPDGTYLNIMFNNQQDDEGKEVVQVEFYRNNSQEVTGEGDAQRIFATVLNAIQKYIKKYKPSKLSFSASKATDPTIYYEPDQPQPNPESRAKLYDRLVQRYARAWGYQAFRADNGDLVIYELSRLKQGVVESVNDYLWHGSRYRNEVLVPRQANDTGGKEESNKNAIYATPSAKVAIAMGLTTPGSDTGMFPNDPQMVLFKGGIRKGEMVYLHKVPKDLFIKHNSREWYSKPDVKEITPIEVVTVPVDKWLSLIRTATPKDLELQKKNMKKQGVSESSDNNVISFKVQKGKNKFATTLSVGGDPVGVYQYDANTGRSIAEIYPEFKGKGLGKLLVLHAIYTAANLGLDFQEDESRTSEYDNVLDSLSGNGYIVDDNGYWYVTGDGEQYLQQSLKQGVSEARGLAPTKPYDDLMANMGYFMSLNTVKIQQDAVDSNAQQELANMQQQFRQPILNGMSFFDVNRDIKISKNPKVAPILLKYVYDMIGYIEPRIKKYVKPDQQGKYLDRLNQIKNDYRAAIAQVS